VAQFPQRRVQRRPLRHLQVGQGLQQAVGVQQRVVPAGLQRGGQRRGITPPGRQVEQARTDGGGGQGGYAVGVHRQKIVIVTPALADANNGNWQTARRWRQMLGQLTACSWRPTGRPGSPVVMPT
jgi:hypothetical protein